MNTSTVGGRPARRRRLGVDEEYEETPEEITWRHLEAGGEEITMTGAVWAPAPPWRGLPAMWVRVPRPAADGPWTACRYVVRAARRVEASGGRGRAPSRRGGRWVEKGECWTDPAVRGWQAKQEEDHLRMLERKSIPCDPLPDWLFDVLSDREKFEMMFA